MIISFYPKRFRAYALVAASVASLILSISLPGCGGGSGAARTVAPPPKTLSSISVSPVNPSVALGSTAQFWATGNYSDGTKQDLTSIVSWKTAQPSVATIDSTGMATTKGTGATAVTATSGSVSSSQTLTVSAATLVSVAVGPQNLSLKPGFSVQLTATGTYSDGSHQDLTASAIWTSSLPTVATIGSSGVATAVAGGSTTITATSGSLSGSDVLGVASLVSISVTPTAPTIPLDQTQQLSATGNFSDNSTEDLTSSVTWGSNAPTTASVNSAGLVSALGQGSATVTAQSGTITGTDLVTVGPPVYAFLETEDSFQQTPLGDAELAALQSECAFVGILGSGQGVCTCGTGDLGSGPASASSDTSTLNPQLAVTYFDSANLPGLQADANVRLSNPGVTGGNLCAMLYVFDQNQELNECCGCVVTPDGLRTLSVNTDLTSNPLTGVIPHTGVIKMVAADFASNPTCNAAYITPEGRISTWATHIQSFIVNTLPGN